MTPEEFFEQAQPWWDSYRAKVNYDLPRRVDLSLYEDHLEDGYVCSSRGRIGYGDTVADAIEACFDHLTNKKSKRSRKHHNGVRIAYDYRAEGRLA